MCYQVLSIARARRKVWSPLTDRIAIQKGIHIKSSIVTLLVQKP